MTTFDQGEPLSPLRWLSRLALVLAIVLVVVRAMVSESIREVGNFEPGVLTGPGPTEIVLLDWLAFLPALLVLIRRIIDKQYTLRFGLAHGLLGLLAVLALCSVSWASDKYLALIGAGSLLGGAALLWTFSQVVRKWEHIRIIAGVAVGLLLVQAAHGVIWMHVEMPETQRSFNNNRDEFLRQLNIEEGSFAAQQIQQRVNNSAMMGFTASPNIFGAIVVMLGVVALGCLVQRVIDERRRQAERGEGPREDGWAIAPLLGVLIAPYLLYCTGSKAGFAGALLGITLLVGWRLLRGVLVKNHGFTFAVGLLLVMLGFCALAATGLYLGRLPEDSLNFRWRYWVGSWGMITAHPLLGVGWANFGDTYLAHRLPMAAEEIKDPHNWLMRLVTELGVVGLGLGVLWAALLAYRMTRPLPADVKTPETTSAVAVMPLLWIVVLGIFVGGVVGVGFTANPDLVMWEWLKRVLYGLLLAVGVGCVPIVSMKNQTVDDRPAPWILASMIVGVGMMLVLSVIDVSLFAPGAWMMTIMLAGAVMGIRLHQDELGKRGSAAVVTTAIVLGVAWFAMLITVVVPVAWSTMAARPARSAKTLTQATEALEAAVAAAPVANSDYMAQLAGLYERGNDPAKALQWADQAVASDPRSPSLLIQRARLRERQRPSDPQEVAKMLADFRGAIAANPMEIDFRLGFAERLLTLGKVGEAIEQVSAARDIASKMDVGEPERLIAEPRLQELEKRLPTTSPR
jgi:O-antigen ligase